MTVIAVIDVTPLRLVCAFAIFCYLGEGCVTFCFYDVLKVFQANSVDVCSALP